MENQIFELQYAIDTFYFLICGALVMWMAAGFSMLESGLVRAKNTTEILTKNVALYAIACFMYLASGYAIMYGGGYFLTGIEAFNLDEVLAASAENGFDGGSVYSGASDFFFQVVFVATAMSIVSGAVAERMKLWAFFVFAAVMTGFIYPMEGSWTWGGKEVFGLFSLGDLGFSDFAGSGIVHLAGAAAALAGLRPAPRWAGRPVWPGRCSYALPASPAAARRRVGPISRFRCAAAGAVAGAGWLVGACCFYTDLYSGNRAVFAGLNSYLIGRYSFWTGSRFIVQYYRCYNRCGAGFRAAGTTGSGAARAHGKERSPTHQSRSGTSRSEGPGPGERHARQGRGRGESTGASQADNYA